MNNEEKKYICTVSRSLSDSQKKEWQRLWSGSELRHIFNSLAFFEACSEVFEYKEYAVIFCYREGAISGILPLVEDRVFGIKVFSCPGRKGNYADKNAILASEYDQDIFNALLGKASELGSLCLAELNEKEKLMLSFQGLPNICRPASRSRCFSLIQGQIALGAMPVGQKRALLRRIHLREKDLEFRFYETGLEEALDKVIEVEKKSYKFRRHMAFFRKDKEKKFFQAIIRRSSENVRIGILYFHGKPAASVLGFVYGKTFAGYHISFSEEYRSWGAGKAAIYFTLENLKNSGFTKVDLLRGDTNLKQQLANKVNSQFDLYFSKNPVVLFWWRVCIPAKALLDKIKMFLLASLSRVDHLRNIFRSALFEDMKIYFKTLEGILDKGKNMPEGKFFDSEASEPICINKNKKPIVFFSTYDNCDNPYYGGGGAISIHEVAKRLTAKFEVHVLAGKYPHCPKQKLLDGVHYEYVGSNFFGPKLGHLAYHFVLPFYAMRRKFDLWVESFTPPFSTSFLPLFTKKPVIGLVHMLSAEDMRRKYYIPFGYVENFGIKMYDNFIVLTKQTGDCIKKTNPKANVEIIPNGVNLSYPAGRSVKKHLLFIGRIEIDQKGLDLLLQSYKLIMDKIDYPLVIAGQGIPEEEIKLTKMINDYKFYGKVRYLGKIEGQKKSEIFQDAAGVVISSRFETFSLVALESLAYGVPIISFDIEGLKWLPQDLSFKVKPFDVSAMAGIIKSLLEKNSRLSIDSNSARIFLKDYSWEIVAEKFEKRFASVIKPNF